MERSRYQKYLHYRIPLDRSIERFREMVLYVSQKCESAEFFGATKLNKILYWSDMDAFRLLGRPITGAEYWKLEKGPAPKYLTHVRQDMIEEGLIRIEKRMMVDYPQHRTVALRDPNMDIFTVSEREIVDRVITECWGQTADEVSNVSHNIVWHTRNLRDPIPYEASYLDPSPLTEEEHTRSQELAQQYGWE
jgi:hypothetical protein